MKKRHLAELGELIDTKYFKKLWSAQAYIQTLRGVELRYDMIGARFDTPLAFPITVQGDRRALRFIPPHLAVMPGYRLVKAAARQVGIQTFVATNTLLGVAGIRTSSIEIIDQKETRRSLPEQTLLRARVVSPWGSPNRDAYFMSGYDLNEPWWKRSYFFCELPQGSEPETWDEAIELLKPKAVVEAQRRGLRVKRQGDIFAIRLPKREAESLVRDKQTEEAYVHSTNHKARKAVLLVKKDSTTILATGVVVHAPHNRPADHGPMRLGNRWYILIKNTVPIVVTAPIRNQRHPRPWRRW